MSTATKDHEAHFERLRKLARDGVSDPRTVFDPVQKPEHYNSHPSGLEVIQFTEHMNFCLGNAVKYIMRCDLKENPIQDLEKAIWYIQRELNRRKNLGGNCDKIKEDSKEACR